LTVTDFQECYSWAMFIELWIWCQIYVQVTEKVGLISEYFLSGKDSPYI